jgi:CRISPR-associated protein Cas5d
MSHYEIQMEIAGDTAMWTRPDTGDCPVSYPAPTYSAVKAILEAILWGPAISITPLKVEICKPIQYHSYHTNYGGPLRKPELVKNKSSHQVFATVLVDVCYRLYAKVRPSREKDRLPESALEWDKKTTSPGHAYQDIFFRRLRRGQCHSIPVLGWKEFTPSYFGDFRDATQVLVDLPQIEIPSMLRQLFSGEYNSTVSFVYDTGLVIRNGVLEYPPRRAQKC